MVPELITPLRVVGRQACILAVSYQAATVPAERICMPSAITLAPRKHLHTGRSVWSANPHRPFALQHLGRSLRCDVAIVGAGISGAFMAYELSRHYRDVVVLDRRGPATGSTHASTAMLQFEIDTPLTTLCDRIGVRKAERAWRMSYLATQRLVRLVRQEQIVCDLERRN